MSIAVLDAPSFGRLTRSRILWPKKRSSPAIKTSLGDIRLRIPNTIMLQPIAQITCSTMKLKKGLAVMPKVIKVTSTKTSHKPLLIRKTLASGRVFFKEDRYADTPERKTKVGAQKCVIHLVK